VSLGKTKEEQKKQAVSYLRYLLLARPDLQVAQGMLIDQKQVLFLLGIEGVGIRSVSVTWKSSNLPKLMYAFIYRLKPAHFTDPSYVSVKPDVLKKICQIFYAHHANEYKRLSWIFPLICR
jgi:hypothetical protein